MLTIRLQRVGKKNKPAFRIVLAEKYRSAKKQALEILGHYNPRSKEFGIKNQDRLKYWIEQHVEISPTVKNLFVTKGLLSGSKIKAWRPKIKPAEAVAATAAQPAPTPAQAVAETPKPEAPAAEAETKPETAPETKAADQKV